MPDPRALLTLKTFIKHLTGGAVRDAKSVNLIGHRIPGPKLPQGQIDDLASSRDFTRLFTGLGLGGVTYGAAAAPDILGTPLSTVTNPVEKLIRGGLRATTWPLRTAVDEGKSIWHQLTSNPYAQSPAVQPATPPPGGASKIMNTLNNYSPAELGLGALGAGALGYGGYQLTKALTTGDEDEEDAPRLNKTAHVMTPNYVEGFGLACIEAGLTKEAAAGLLQAAAHLRTPDHVRDAHIAREIGIDPAWAGMVALRRVKLASAFGQFNLQSIGPKIQRGIEGFGSNISRGIMNIANPIRNDMGATLQRSGEGLRAFNDKLPAPLKLMSGGGLAGRGLQALGGAMRPEGGQHPTSLGRVTESLFPTSRPPNPHLDLQVGSRQLARRVERQGELLRGLVGGMPEPKNLMRPRGPSEEVRKAIPVGQARVPGTGSGPFDSAMRQAIYGSPSGQR